MARTKDRQRALARAKLERQIARRAAAARRKRQIQAGTAAGLALVLVVLGVLWTAGVFKSDKKKTEANADCAWTDTTGTKDVGRPPTHDIPKGGAQTMTITTNLGEIDAIVDVAKVPCTAASFSFLASKKYFDNVACHRLTTSGAFILQCGDPNGDGKGGPGYRFKDENLPVKAPDPNASASPSADTQVDYPAGTLAMANSGADTNGSQFFIVYKDSKFDPKYTVIGQVTKGLDIVSKVGADGVEPGASNAADGKPKTQITIQSLTMSQPNATPAASNSAPPASGSPAPSASTGSS